MPIRVLSRSSNELTRKRGDAARSRTGHPESRKRRGDLTNARVPTQITVSVTTGSVFLCEVPRSSRDDTAFCDRDTDRQKATGAPEKALFRGGRLWVHLWRNLTHR